MFPRLVRKGMRRLAVSVDLPAILWSIRAEKVDSGEVLGTGVVDSLAARERKVSI